MDTVGLYKSLGIMGLICYDSRVLFITGPMAFSRAMGSIQLSTMNQKFPDTVTKLGGSFVAGPAMFMVTDELVVKPLSPMLGISFLSNFNIPVSDIEERIVCMGKKEVK